MAPSELPKLDEVKCQLVHNSTSQMQWEENTNTSPDFLKTMTRLTWKEQFNLHPFLFTK